MSEATLSTGSGRDAMLAWRDLCAAAHRWPLIVRLSWNDIRQRYRRSTLGPSWLTISLAVQVAAMGFVYGGLFNLKVAAYLPHLAAGITVWALMAGMINEGCLCFIAAEGYLKQMALPKSMFAARVVLRCLFNFGHDIVIVIVVLLIYPPAVDWTIVLFVPGLLILALNGLWVGLVLGILCTRFRDLPPIVASVIQVAFFITPVIWIPASLNGHAARFLAYNPFAVFLSLVRDPLMGQAATLSSWLIVAAITVCGWALAFALFARFRARITYWL